MVLPTTLTMASALCPRRLASRSAASVSAVSPDCEMTSSTVFFSMRTIAITKFVRELDLDRDLRQFLDEIFAHQRRVPARAAGGDDQAVNPAQFGRRQVQAAEAGGGAFLIHATAQGVFDGARLLENFLEHEVCVFAAHGVFLAENSKLLIWTFAVSVPRFNTSKRSGVTVATS